MVVVEGGEVTRDIVRASIAAGVPVVVRTRPLLFLQSILSS
jgi:acetyltransferase-like isoleucine patch superfamily enzyme